MDAGAERAVLLFGWLWVRVHVVGLRTGDGEGEAVGWLVW